MPWCSFGSEQFILIGKMNAADLFDRSQLKSGPKSGASNAGAIAAMKMRVIGNKERGK